MRPNSKKKKKNNRGFCRSLTVAAPLGYSLVSLVLNPALTTMRVYASAERRAHCVFDFVFAFVYSLKSRSKRRRGYSENGTPRRRIVALHPPISYIVLLLGKYFF